MDAANPAPPATSADAAARRLRAPWLGLLAFAVVITWRPVAHSLTMLVHGAFTGPAQLAASFLLGALGVVLMWQGLRREESAATVLGILAGSFIWTGWCEQSFNSFAALLGVAPLKWNGFTLFTPGLLMIEASVVLMLVMLIMLGSNKDTQCRMFLWFHRNLRLDPGPRTPGYRRQIARIATLEYLFVVWFFYVLNLLIFDPRVLGPDHPGAAVALLAIAAWGVYLVWKLCAVRAPGLALRYAVPCVGCAWLLIESAAAMRLFREIWLEPFEFPGVMAAWAVVSAALFAGYARLRNPGDAVPGARVAA